MNCVNYVKKTVCMVLMLAFVLISCLGAFATSENPKKTWNFSKLNKNN